MIRKGLRVKHFPLTDPDWLFQVSWVREGYLRPFPSRRQPLLPMELTAFPLSPPMFIQVTAGRHIKLVNVFATMSHTSRFQMLRLTPRTWVFMVVMFKV